MQKIRLALLIGDGDYRNRLSGHLLLHEKDRFEVHIFTEAAQMEEDQKEYDLVLCSDCMEEAFLLAKSRTEPFLYLSDSEREDLQEANKERMQVIEKYQNVNVIVDEILRNIGTEIRQVRQNGEVFRKTQVIAVYSLAENEYQLPFLVTLASVLGEEHRVLILDLQENSGFLHLPLQAPEGGMEEVLAMAERGRYSRNRLLSCIGHMDHADYIYPAENTECLCEANSGMYLRLLQMLGEELDYSVILLNMGSRFNGFFEVLNQCRNIYLMSKSGGLCQWREYEFTEEAAKHGYAQITERITKVEIPATTVPTNCERIVEQWKWNELGDMIRRMLLPPVRTEGAGA